MPKGSPELTEKRKNEILDACEKIYAEKGFYGINIKQISTEITLTRSAIYNYFETKEEILLGLLIREYQNWCNELEKIAEFSNNLNRLELSKQIAHTLENKETLLRILNMNLFEIEQNSRVERLAKFKVEFKKSISVLCKILHCYQSDISDIVCEEFCEMFSAFLFGVFPFTKHTQKQLEAMQMAGVSMEEPSIYEMINRCLLKMLTEKE